MSPTLRLSPPPGIQPGTVVVIGEGSRHTLSRHLEQLLPGRRGFVVGDEHVLELWFDDVDLDASGVLALPPGEDAKTPEVLTQVCRTLADAGLPRDGFLVALGGGATGDVVGLAASLHLRGVPIVQVPTTLLSMVDAGLGGKCAVNLPEGKNLLGSFWAPTLMLVDPEFTTTLPELEVRSGIGEIAKYALGFSPELFAQLEGGALQGPQERVIETCLRIKASIVDEDPFEQAGGRRALLNLGHTTAHALEAWATANATPVPHGLAVAWGLRVACDLAVAEKVLPQADRDRAFALLDRLALPRSPGDLVPEPPGPDDLRPYLGRDKKRAEGELRMVLPTAIGACELREVAVERVTAVLR